MVKGCKANKMIKELVTENIIADHVLIPAYLAAIKIKMSKIKYTNKADLTFICLL
jgi:hypothetical protein